MQVTLENFKNYKERDFKLEGSTAITGRNGSGKTSVLEAIMFAFYGRDFYGRIAVDGYLSKGADLCSVVVDTGTIRVKRTFGSNNSVALNNREQKQTELLAKLPPLSLAYAVVNPLYILFELGDLDLRSLFMDNIPLPDPVEIFKQEYGEDEELVERFRTGDYQNIRNQYKTLQNTIESLEKDITVKEGDILANKSQIKQIEDNRVTRPRGVLKREEDRQREIDELNQKLGETEGIKSEIQSLKDQLELIRRDLEKPLEEYGVSTLSELIVYYRDIYNEFSNRISQLEAENTLKEAFVKEASVGGSCPLCNQDVGEIDLKEQIQREIKVNKGLIKDLIPKMEKAEEALETAVEMKEETLNIKDELVKQRKKLSRRKKLAQKIEDLKSKQKGLSQEDFKNAVEAEAQTKMLSSLKSRIKNAQETIERNRESLKSTREELEGIEVLKEALSPQGVSANQAKTVGKIIEERLKGYFTDRKVSVKTIRKNKTNENYREVFDIKIDGVHYMNLSFGERILVAIVLGLLLRENASPFMFNFVLLDEASVLSKETLNRIIEVLGDVDLIYTRATNNDLSLDGIAQ